MKRYRVLSFDIDSRASTLTRKIRDEWEETVKETHRENKRQVKQSILEQFGDQAAEAKLENFAELGDMPFSILAFHNKFLHQVRSAFVIGAYYPALTGACTLGERILNHLILLLRDDYLTTPQYKNVYSKQSFDNWNLPIVTLKAWNVLLPAAANHFRELSEVRNRAIHFEPETDHNDRPMALEAIHLLSAIISEQFAAFGPQPWFISGIRGASYIKKEAEVWPFVEKVYLPNCVLVGPYHEVIFEDNRLIVQDDHEYEDKEISDEEFRVLLTSK